MTKDDLFTQADLLARGWTKRLIKELLPEPELRKNPVFSSAAPMKVWEPIDVDGAENTDESKAWIFAKRHRVRRR